jgi:hypothetical protein
MASQRIVLTFVAAAMVGGCAAKPAAQVSGSELATLRQTNASMKIGDPKLKVLESYKSGNKVKLGSSAIDGAVIEEWKIEGFHDEKNRKDLFVSFLYFRNDVFVDSSDTRIDFRNKPEITDRWK